MEQSWLANVRAKEGAKAGREALEAVLQAELVHRRARTDEELEEIGRFLVGLATVFAIEYPSPVPPGMMVLATADAATVVVDASKGKRPFNVGVAPIQCPDGGATLASIPEKIVDCGTAAPEGCTWITCVIAYSKAEDADSCGYAVSYTLLYHPDADNLLMPARNHRERCRIYDCPNVTHARCGACQRPDVRYCSRDCQVADWFLHKRECQKKE
jgi:hypothetical protein